MKIALIVVSLKETKKAATKVGAIFKMARLGELRTYIVINQIGTEGYARGVNKGLEMAKSFKPDIYIVANPDLEKIKISKKILL